MSEPLTISELLTCVLGGDYLNYSSDVEVLADIARMLAAHDAGVRREQMEADIALISGVEIGSYTIPEEIRLDLTGRNLETLVAIMERGWDGCKEFAVAQLRAAYAKAEQQRKGGTV